MKNDVNKEKKTIMEKKKVNEKNEKSQKCPKCDLSFQRIPTKTHWYRKWGEKARLYVCIRKNLKNVTFVMLTANEYFNAVIAGLVFWPKTHWKIT